MSSTDVATTPEARAMPEPTKKLAATMYDAILNGTPLPQIGDPEVAARMILEELINAPIERVLQAQSLPAWQEFALDVPVTILSFHTNPSKFEGGSSAYAVVEIEYADGAGELQRQLVSVGGQKVLVQLVKYWETGNIPFRAKLTRKDTSTPGRIVLGLEPVT